MTTNTNNGGSRLVASLLLYVAATWLVMLAVGIVHAHVLPSMLAAGFDQVALLVGLGYASTILLGAATEL